MGTLQAEPTLTGVADNNPALTTLNSILTASGFPTLLPTLVSTLPPQSAVLPVPQTLQLIHSLLHTITTQTARYADIMSALSVSQSDIKTLRDKITRVSKDKDSLERDLAKKQLDIHSGLKKVGDVEEKCKRLENELRTARRDVVSLAGALTSVKSGVASSVFCCVDGVVEAFASSTINVESDGGNSTVKQPVSRSASRHTLLPGGSSSSSSLSNTPKGNSAHFGLPCSRCVASKRRQVITQAGGDLDGLFEIIDQMPTTHIGPRRNSSSSSSSPGSPLTSPSSSPLMKRKSMSGITNSANNTINGGGASSKTASPLGSPRLGRTSASGAAGTSKYGNVGAPTATTPPRSRAVSNTANTVGSLTPPMSPLSSRKSTSIEKKVANSSSLPTTTAKTTSTTMTTLTALPSSSSSSSSSTTKPIAPTTRPPQPSSIAASISDAVASLSSSTTPPVPADILLNLQRILDTFLDEDSFANNHDFKTGGGSEFEDSFSVIHVNQDIARRYRDLEREREQFTKACVELGYERVKLKEERCKFFEEVMGFRTVRVVGDLDAVLSEVVQQDV